MPRNSSGTFSWPASAARPVVSGTAISSTAQNAADGDVSAELTDSLSRSGKGGMSAPLRVPDGTVAAPTLSFSNETGSGWFRIAAGRIGAAILGVLRLEVNSTGAKVTGTLDSSGKATLNSLEVTGAATVGTTLGVTGDTTLTGSASVAGASGLTLSGGGLFLTQAADQSVYKTGGSLQLASGTAGKHVWVSPGGTGTWTFDGSTGNLSAPSGKTVTGLATPSAASDAATKGYVDGMTDGYAGNAWASGGSWTANWSNDGSNTTRIWKTANGVVHMYVIAALSTGTSGSAFTLPTGYRPASRKAGIAFKTSDALAIGIEIASTGVVSSPANFTNTTYEFSATFPTT